VGGGGWVWTVSPLRVGGNQTQARTAYTYKKNIPPTRTQLEGELRLGEMSLARVKLLIETVCGGFQSKAEINSGDSIHWEK
jgi:hypothetical protein